MVFKRKKGKEKKEPTAQEAEPTDIVDAEISDKQASQKPKQPELPEELKFVLDEFAKNYNSIFTAKDFAELRPDTVQSNILFAIYSELRLLRRLVQEEREEGE